MLGNIICTIRITQDAENDTPDEAILTTHQLCERMSIAVANRIDGSFFRIRSIGRRHAHLRLIDAPAFMHLSQSVKSLAINPGVSPNLNSLPSSGSPALYRRCFRKHCYRNMPARR